MVGYYFERRRGFAAGIASAGAGFGMLVLTTLAAQLEENYTWKGTLIILAGVSLNCIACGALMRPLPQPSSPTANANKVIYMAWF
jgi:MFS family permease